MTVIDDGKDDIEASRAPLMSHLLELRSRIVRSFVVLLAISLINSRQKEVQA